ncbi:MAG: hypothetical protein DHS20C20_21610 [Ardenticatenaceae bacterium]|nr:MAG: hypothetical protein DHS20C20_21610 [Ardenticatenaceae bacterium]
MKKGLLIGIRTTHLAELAQRLGPIQFEIRVATNLDVVDRILMQEKIEFVFLGFEHDSKHQLKMLAHIFTISPISEIHVMGYKSDPAAFVVGILASAGIE